MRAARAVVLALAFVACTQQAKDGPAEVKWDRDTCKSCSMVISEHDFAAQVRGGPKGEVFKFDDLGCAISWLAKQSWADEPATRIWVAKHGDGAWLDARTARYLEGKSSPMGFGFAAVDSGQAGLSFDEVKAKVLALKAAH
ncbi:MAG: nitrous oxide reductase accessory protein NosL [Myxococcota bacterium]